MRHLRIPLAVAIVMALTISAEALWSVADHGAWPKTWPEELEPLRKQSGTIVGGGLDFPIHHIPFQDRDQFEQAWPQLLKVKTPGAPIVLLRSPNTHWHFKKTKAGVFVHCPCAGVKEPKLPAKPRRPEENVASHWFTTTYLELVVDGETVDLNRIELPADAPIIDLRFADEDELGDALGRYPSGRK